MPNIEIHGFGPHHYHRVEPADFYKRQTELAKLQTAITEILMDFPFAEDAVITTFDSRCRYLNGKPAPFLRVCDTDYERAKAIAGPLMKLEIDIEVIQLDSFYPAQKTLVSPA